MRSQASRRRSAILAASRSSVPRLLRFHSEQTTRSLLCYSSSYRSHTVNSRVNFNKASLRFEPPHLPSVTLPRVDSASTTYTSSYTLPSPHIPAYTSPFSLKRTEARRQSKSHNVDGPIPRGAAGDPVVAADGGDPPRVVPAHPQHGAGRQRGARVGAERGASLRCVVCNVLVSEREVCGCS